MADGFTGSFAGGANLLVAYTYLRMRSSWFTWHGYVFLAVVDAIVALIAVRNGRYPLAAGFAPSSALFAWIAWDEWRRKRRKKPRKVLARIRDLGHRLVTVPAPG